MKVCETAKQIPTKPIINQYFIPEFMLSAVINADETALTDNESDDLNSFIDMEVEHNGYECFVFTSDYKDQGFMLSNDIYDSGDNVVLIDVIIGYEHESLETFFISETYHLNSILTPTEIKASTLESACNKAQSGQIFEGTVLKVESHDGTLLAYKKDGENWTYLQREV